MLCKAGGLDKEDIGAIRVQDTESFVEIRAASVKTFLSSLGKKLRLEGGIVTQLESPPSIANSPRPKFEPRQKDRKPRKPKQNDGAPVQWNDDPKPRKKKPKKSGTPAPTPVGKANSKKNKARRAAATKPGNK